MVAPLIDGQNLRLLDCQGKCGRGCGTTRNRLWSQRPPRGRRGTLNRPPPLIDAFDPIKQSAEVGFAWMEAWERGREWRSRLARGAMRLSDDPVVQSTKLDGRGIRQYGLADSRGRVSAKPDKERKHHLVFRPDHIRTASRLRRRSTSAPSCP